MWHIIQAGGDFRVFGRERYGEVNVSPHDERVRAMCPGRCVGHHKLWIVQANKFELVINMQTARMLDLVVPRRCSRLPTT
jgi:hypothetical protein